MSDHNQEAAHQVGGTTKSFSVVWIILLVLTGVAALGASGLLAAYGAAFQRKTRNL